jgi:hypothetical protein
MKPTTPIVMVALLSLTALPAGHLVGQEPPVIANAGQQIASAVSAAPEDRRQEATVLGYDGDGTLVELRNGSNELICLADNPKDDRFQVVCYHESLEPFMVRGRELRVQGLGSTENMSTRHAEADEGKLRLPESPAALYNLGGPLEIYDAETGAVNGGHWVWVLYTPYSTESSTGLPTTPQAPGAPWIMRPGTASSHIMIVQPRDPEPASD